MSNQPEIAPKDLRLAIIEALRDERRFFSRSDHTSRNYLELWEINEETIYTDLAESLEQNELLVIPPAKPTDRRKYQHLLCYPEEEGLPEILIHVKLNPLGEPIRVKVSVHPHNTGYSPIPTIPAPPN